MKCDQVVAKLDNTGHGQVWVNGVPLKSSLGMKVYCAGGLMTVVELRLLADYTFSGPAVLIDNPQAEQGIKEWVLNGPGVETYELTPEGKAAVEQILDEEFRDIIARGLSDDNSEAELA